MVVYFEFGFMMISPVKSLCPFLFSIYKIKVFLIEKYDENTT